MVKFENTEVYGWEAALRGMRNPFNSWDKSDTAVTSYWMKDTSGAPIIGEADKTLGMRLTHAGTEHGKWLRMVQVWVDITAPRFWWSEFDTYKVGTTANSQSTMHKLKDIDLMDTSNYDFPYGMDQDADAAFDNYLFALSSLQLRMNECKKQGDDNGKHWAEEYHHLLKAMLPEGFYQTRTVNLNYAVLRNMYRQRKNHRLPQWSEDFTSWIKTLPYSEFITAD